MLFSYEDTSATNVHLIPKLEVMFSDLLSCLKIFTEQRGYNQNEGGRILRFEKQSKY